MSKSNTVSFDEQFMIVEGIQAGRSLRDIGREYGIRHQKVYLIGAAAGVYSVRSKKAARVSAELGVVPILVPEDDFNNLEEPVEERYVPRGRVYGNNVWQRHQRTGLPYRKVACLSPRRY